MLFTVPAGLLFSVSSFRIVSGHGGDFRIESSSSGAELNMRFGEGILEGHDRDHELRNRQASQACGPDIGSCPRGQCCSAGGHCGTGINFCGGPACQLAYGPACDGNIIPPGASTVTVSRAKIGNVPYGGAGIYHCTSPGVIALTFDDGPYNFTVSVLATLAKYNVTATFFINGNSLGKGQIDDPTTPWPQILRDMHAAGHQLASHTWTHQDLTSLSIPLMQNQVIYNEMAFRNIFGWIPTYLRPPYGYCTGPTTCADYLDSMGYHIIYWDVDTKDYLNDDPALIVNSKNYFAGNISNPARGHSYIPLAHDIHQQTALTLVSYMLDTLNARGYKVATVGECLGDPQANWYRDAGGIPSSTSTSISTAVTSQVTSTASKTSTTSTTAQKGTALAETTASSHPVVAITTISHPTLASSTIATVSKSAGNTLHASGLLSCVLVILILTFGLGKVHQER